MLRKGMNTVHDIIKNSLCLGCGLCEALDKENCKMVINQEGFYEPHIQRSTSNRS